MTLEYADNMDEMLEECSICGEILLNHNECDDTLCDKCGCLAFCNHICSYVEDL